MVGGVGGCRERWRSSSLRMQLCWRANRKHSPCGSLPHGRSGLAMDVYGGSTSSGAKIDQWYWSNTSNRIWKVVSMGNCNYELLSQKSGLALGVPRHLRSRFQYSAERNGARPGNSDRRCRPALVLQQLSRDLPATPQPRASIQFEQRSAKSCSNSTERGCSFSSINSLFRLKVTEGPVTVVALVLWDSPRKTS